MTGPSALRALLALGLLVPAACEADDPTVVPPPSGAATEAPPADASRSPSESAGTVAAAPSPSDPSRPPPAPPEPGTWAALPAAPVELTEVAAAAFAGQLWVAGGLDAGGDAVDVVQLLDPQLGSWTEGTPLPRAVHHAALVSDGAELWLLGGYEGAGFARPTDAVWRFSAASGRWAEGPALPQPRAAGAAAWDGERIVYGGGVGPQGLAGDVWALRDGDWAEAGRLAVAREHVAAASDGRGRVVFLGGRAGGLDTNVASVDLVVGEQVDRLPDLPTARSGAAAFWGGDPGACLAGGEGPDGTFADVECIDASGAVRALAPLSQPRHGLGAAVLDGSAYALLGGPSPGLHVSGAAEALRLPPPGGQPR